MKGLNEARKNESMKGGKRKESMKKGRKESMKGGRNKPMKG